MTRRLRRRRADPFLPPTSVVVTSSPVTDIKATLITAAHQAAEAAIRAVKPGSKNWEVTAAIKQVLDEYESAGVKGVEGVLSHQVGSTMFGTALQS